MNTDHFYGIMFLMIAITGCQSLNNKSTKALSYTISHYSTLPSVVDECSGLVIDETGIYVINDGGAGPFLYHLDEKGNKVIKVIAIPGAENEDWEAITVYKEEILICDFGNNNGKRKDLKIYHVDKKTFEINKVVEFAYPDQVKFDDPKHNFDCESMVVIDDEYVLFTKNRGNTNSNIYTSPIGEAAFQFKNSIQVPGLVTDACYDEKNKKILLVSYNYSVLGGFQCQLSVVGPSRKGKFKMLKSFDIEYKEQIEAIARISDNSFLIGSENVNVKGGNLYKIDMKGL